MAQEVTHNSSTLFAISEESQSESERSRSKSPEEAFMHLREPMDAVTLNEFPNQIIQMIEKTFETIPQVNLAALYLIQQEHIPDSGMIKGRMQDGKVYVAFRVIQEEENGVITLYQESKKRFSITTTYPFGIKDLRFEEGPLTADLLQLVQEIFNRTHAKIALDF